MNLLIISLYLFSLTNFFVYSLNINIKSLHIEVINKLIKNKINLQDKTNNQINVDIFIKNNVEYNTWSKIKFTPKISSYFYFYNCEFSEMANNVKYINCEKELTYHIQLLVSEINMMNHIIELLIAKKKLYTNKKDIVEWLNKIILNEIYCLNNTKMLFVMYLDQKYKLLK